jgi:ABC-type polysaccharide/polyol phosphate export permease
MIVAYQDILFFNTIPSVLSLVYLYVFAVALLVVGHTVFSRYHETFGEYL